MTEDTASIRQAIDHGVVFTYDDGVFEYKAKRYTPRADATFRFDDDYKFTIRVHWKDTAGLGHVCDFEGLIQHMVGKGPLDQWVGDPL